MSACAYNVNVNNTKKKKIVYTSDKRCLFVTVNTVEYSNACKQAQGHSVIHIQFKIPDI